MTKKKQVLECEKKLLTAFTDSNIEIIDQLLRDSLLFNNPTGQTITKEIEVASFPSGILSIKCISSSDQIVQVVDDTATVAVTISLRGKYGNNPIVASHRVGQIGFQAKRLTAYQQTFPTRTNTRLVQGLLKSTLDEIDNEETDHCIHQENFHQ